MELFYAFWTGVHRFPTIRDFHYIKCFLVSLIAKGISSNNIYWKVNFYPFCLGFFN